MVWPSSFGSVFYLYLTKHSMLLFMYRSYLNAYKICVSKCSHEPMTIYNKVQIYSVPKKTEPIFESPISRWSWEFLEVLGQNLGISQDILEVGHGRSYKWNLRSPPTHRLGRFLGRFFQYLGYSWEEIFKDLGISLEIFLTGSAVSTSVARHDP